MSTEVTLVDALAAAVPASLDDIIRGQAREHVQLSLATGDDFDALAGQIEPDAFVSDELDDWRIVRMGLRSDTRATLFLVGYAKRAGAVWGTSALTVLDLKQRLARTKNSVYRLLRPGIGEPDFHQLVHVCALLHHWGVGARLGVPHVFC